MDYEGSRDIKKHFLDFSTYCKMHNIKKEEESKYLNVKIDQWDKCAKGWTDAESTVLSEAMIICCTLNMTGSVKFADLCNTIDYLIVDEAC